MISQPPAAATTKDLRNFGLVVGGVFGIIGLWPLVWRGEGVRTWAVGLAVLLIVPAATVPGVLRPVHRAWMWVGHWMGWVNTRLLLFMLFYGIVTPLGLLRRIWQRDAMGLKFSPSQDSYRNLREARPASHLHHPF